MNSCVGQAFLSRAGANTGHIYPVFSFFEMQANGQDFTVVVDNVLLEQ